MRFNDVAHLNLPYCDADAPPTPMTPLPTHILTVSTTGAGSVTPAGTTTHDEGSEVILTATWDDTTHYLQSWGGACSGMEGATCTLRPFDDDATVTATFAERCTGGATDPTCIRVVYIGAPDDYTNVADIPENFTFTPSSEGRYEVGRGEQITVVTGGASLPAGYTRFYLQQTPLEFGTPSPVSASQLIPPVGTTYTFTPTTDPEAAALITFDLTAARPHPVRPTHKPELGDVVVTTSFQVVTCASGIAVGDPTANTELVGDCETLLTLKDTLAGTATLNWSAGRPITEWEGITVGGTPRRVTKLSLANSGLTGQIPLRLGDLTALAELRLNDNELTGVIPAVLGDLDNLTKLYLNVNSLTGVIPSSLEQLANLTHAYLAGNDGLRGCVPMSFHDAIHNDAASIDLNVCVENPTVISAPRITEAGTYQIAEIAFDVPEGISFDIFIVDAEEYLFAIGATNQSYVDDIVENMTASLTISLNGAVKRLMVGDLFYNAIDGEGYRYTAPASSDGTMTAQQGVAAPPLYKVRRLARSVRPVPAQAPAPTPSDGATAQSTVITDLASGGKQLPVRNMVIGEPIAVCSEYPYTTADSANHWRGGLKKSATNPTGYIEHNPFRVVITVDLTDTDNVDQLQHCRNLELITTSDRMKPVQIHKATQEKVNDLGPSCRGACAVWYGPVTGPYHTIRRTNIYLNETIFPADNRQHELLELALTHELGHAIGLRHAAPCNESLVSPTQAVMSSPADRLSKCDVRYNRGSVRIEDGDLLLYRLLYKPQRVAGSPALAPIVSAGPNPGTVLVKFDGSQVKNERILVVRRSTDQTAWANAEDVATVYPINSDGVYAMPFPDRREEDTTVYYRVYTESEAFVDSDVYVEDSVLVKAAPAQPVLPPILPPIIPPGLPQPTTHRVQLNVSPSSCGNVTWRSIDGINPLITSTTTSPWDVPQSRTIRSMAPANSATCRFSHWDGDCIRKTGHTCDLVVTGARQATAHYTIPGAPVPDISLTLRVTPSQCGDITWRLVRQAFGSTTQPSQTPGTNTVNVARGTVLAITAPANTSSCRFLSWGSSVCESQGRHCQAGIGNDLSTATATFRYTARSTRGAETTTPHTYSLFGEGPYSWAATCNTGLSTGFGTNLESDTDADAEARQWIRDNCWEGVPFQKQ